MIGDTNYGELTFRGATIEALDIEDPIPAAREPIIGISGTTIRGVIGDGVRPWSELPDIFGGGGGGGAYIEFVGPTLPTGQPEGTLAFNTAPAI